MPKVSRALCGVHVRLGLGTKKEVDGNNENFMATKGF
jgi:hypothetical protein